MPLSRDIGPLLPLTGGSGGGGPAVKPFTYVVDPGTGVLPANECYVQIAAGSVTITTPASPAVGDRIGIIQTNYRNDVEFIANTGQQIWGPNSQLGTNFIFSATNVGAAITAVTQNPCTFVAGQFVDITNALGGTWSNINGRWSVTSVSGTQFTFTVSVAPTGSYTANSANVAQEYPNPTPIGSFGQGIQNFPSYIELTFIGQQVGPQGGGTAGTWIISDDLGNDWGIGLNYLGALSINGGVFLQPINMPLGIIPNPYQTFQTDTVLRSNASTITLSTFPGQLLLIFTPGGNASDTTLVPQTSIDQNKIRPGCAALIFCRSTVGDWITLASTGTRALRVNAVAGPGATPTVDTDQYDVFHFTALAAAITSMTTNLSGVPVDGDKIRISFTDNGTARAITWGASFEASGNVGLPTTTVINTRLDVGFFWNTETSKWRCVAVA